MCSTLFQLVQTHIFQLVQHVAVSKVVFARIEIIAWNPLVGALDPSEQYERQLG